ncbi:hypothetical protein MPSEU_000474700 [Mayamaea pseudoterrestris]|nr:hypothetical protein MPSEU_000474700 [Mayamaea pseudoterrestris]
MNQHILTVIICKKRNRQLSTSQQPQNLLPQAHIPNKGLLYSSTYVPKIGLPTNHFLNGPCEPETLLKAMIGGQYSCERSSRQQRKRWRNLCAKGFPLCNSMFHKHRSFDYHRLLNRFCPLPKLVTQHEIDIADASAAHSSVDGVIKFVSAVLRNVIPLEMMGSSKNLELLVRHAETFVKLRRQETLANKVAMNGMKITHASWLLMASEKSKVRRTDHQLAHFLLLRVVRWIFGHFLVPLLASTFHVTESEMSGKHILYYRKPVWSIFRSLSMAKLLKQQYTEISPKEAMQRLSLQQMGLSRLRLLPKATGVRPIATLCKQEHFRRAAPSLGVELLKYGADDDEETHTHHFKARKRTMRPRNASSACSTNQILSNVFSVLRDEYNRRQNLFGAGVDGLHYFYPRYRAFINTLRSGMSCITPIYFVSVDIRQAYDSIDQNHLLSIVDKVLSQREYCIQRYDVFHPFPSLGRVIKRSQRKVGTSSSVDPLISRSFTKGFRQSVLIDSVNTCVAQKEHLSKQLFEHLRSHLVTIQGRYGDRYLVQSIGIPQGSILSTILCNFFYGSYEQKTLPDFLTSSSVGESATLLIRMVDDFMLATPNRPLAANFLKAMETGDEELGVSINKSKTKVSATMEMDGIVHSDAAIARRFFPWCGMLFDLKSYAVRIDYARLVADDISSGLTVEQSSHQGIRFRAALRTFIRPRCIPILFDCAINDTRTQTINFYQLYIFSAAKMLAYLKSTDMMHKIKHNLKFIIDAIVSSVKYGHSLIRNRLKQSHVGLELGFSRRVALWIGYTAFHDVLIRSQAFLALAEALHGKIVLLRIRSKPVYFKHAIFEAMQSSGIKDILAKSP